MRKGIHQYHEGNYKSEAAILENMVVSQAGDLCRDSYFILAG